MHRILKNYKRIGVKNHFRGKDVWFGPKEAREFNLDDEEQAALYFFWKDRYGFIQDYGKEGDIKK